jgi:hypothetical protein
MYDGFKNTTDSTSKTMLDVLNTTGYLNPYNYSLSSSTNEDILSSNYVYNGIYKG